MLPSIIIYEFLTTDGGILLSKSVMQRIADGLDWCVRNAFSDNDDDNMGRCIVHSSGLPCTSSIQVKIFYKQNLKIYLKGVLKF
jgi:Chondroitin N-acetylgalactosaminyltransferase